MALPVSRLVRVVLNLSPLAAARRSFGVLLVAGDSDVINGLERLRSYDSYEEVVEDFGVDAEESKAAAAYFGQTPAPRTIMIGRWIREATGGINIGGILSASQQALANWTAITNGGVIVPVDGVDQALVGLNFSGATNLNGVASIIDAALSGATCVWDGSKFVITSESSGDGAKASGLITFIANPSPGVRASGTIEVAAQPDPGDTLTIQGTAITFVDGVPGANQVAIGADEAETATNLLTFLVNSANANIALMTYAKIGNIITATARVYGVAGNAYTLATSNAVAITLSGATLAGGVAADTLTVNGTAFTFVAANPTGNQILVGPTAEITAVNANTVLGASVVSGVAEATYSVSSNVVTVLYKEAGTDGNSFTLAESSAGITVSGATLSGGALSSSIGYLEPGAGQDISAMLRGTEATSATLVPGYDAETPVECAAALANKSSVWYGLMFQATVQPTNEESLDVSSFIEALDLKRIYGVTITDSDVLSPLVTNDLASLQKDAGYLRSFCQYSQNAYAIASFIGRAFAVDFNANRSTITMMYKQEPGIDGEELSTTEANTLQDKRCNVYVNYVNDTKIIQYGVMSGPAYFDEIHGLDWFVDAVQNAAFNLLYQSKTKIPQTDFGSNQLTTVIAGACDEAVNNGLLGPGTWNADGFGELERGDFLNAGYYIFAQPMALQSQAEREQRVAPPIQVAAKLAGAIQEVDVIIDVNR